MSVFTAFISSAKSVRHSQQSLLWSWNIHLIALSFTALIPGIWFGLSLTAFGAPPCPCTVFTTPTGHNEVNEGNDLELGFKFKADRNGYITSVRFYKQGAMSGVHVGRLWTSGGTPMANATFTETSSGWQEVSFGTPVAVTAGDTYVASVTMNDGRYISTNNYFATETVNYPLRAPSSSSSGGNGVFNTTGGAFPATSFNATNYWVDVSYRSNIAPDPPEVSSVTPSNGATNLAAGAAITATFDQGLIQSTVNTNTFTVKDAEDNLVAGTVSYDLATSVARFFATNGLAPNKTYTATLEGGSGTAIQNIDGDALAADYSWSFSTGSGNECPCSLKNYANPASSNTFDDTGSVELGMKVRASTSGYITSVRFYKPIISTETSHTVNVWDANGNNLGTATTANETDFGWQEATFGTPVAVNQDQTVVVSYYTTTAVYVATNATTGNGLAANLANGYLTAYATGATENTATGSGTSNGVFRSNQAGYPSSGSGNASYYWIDAVFSTSQTVANPLTIRQTTPASTSYGVHADQSIRAIVNHALNITTVSGTTVRLFNEGNNQVAGSVTYSATDRSITFDPANSLQNNTTYTMRLSGTIADVDGSALGSDYSWSFTVGDTTISDPAQGPGGPVLIVTNSSDTYSQYYAEILRSEGMQYFDVKELSTISASTLQNYDAVIVAENNLSQSQADMFSSWTADGGTLLAMRPDNELSSLLGLTDQGTTRANQYMLIDTTAVPGNGLVAETIQFHGTADNYSLSGATALAALYSDASTVTSNPAVTVRDVGTKGGQAIAFTFDLAKSIVASHQGNQAWAGQNRDGQSPIRPNDLFFGNATGDTQPDWVNLNKFHIPYADEQQRFLANILTEYTRDRKPLPRFWYLPGNYKNAVVMAGDDHGLDNASGSERTINNWINQSPTNCSVEDWECVRASHYVYTNSALTNARALQYRNLGFEIGDHVSNSATCNNYTSFANLQSIYNADLTAWRAKYTSLPNQRTHRMHCYVWSDWDSQPKVEAANGMRFDLNYLAFPGSWFGNRAPVMNGSLLPMRITDASGDLLDFYQGMTNLDDQAANSTAIAAILDNTTNSNNFYGVIGTHYDMSNSYDDTLYAAAKSRSIPMISSDQLLTWLDGRGSSTFSGLSGSNGQYTFEIRAGQGAHNLMTMLPIKDAGGTLTSVKLADNTVGFATEIIKGVQYAVFNAKPGPYTATYSDYVAPTPPPDPDPSGGDSGDNSPGSNNASTSTSRNTRGSQTNGDSSATQNETRASESSDDSKQDEIKLDTATSFPDDSKESTRAKKNAPWVWIVGISALVLFGASIWWFTARQNKKIQ